MPKPPTMRHPFTGLLCALAPSILLLTAAPAQLPPARTTQLPTMPAATQSGPASIPASSAAAPQTAYAPPSQPAYRANVELSANQLSVVADNSSLNQILSDISRLTGMKITGGVKDERVFGRYGPGSQQDVLSQLLDGTGSNVLLLENRQHGVAELVLTPRSGGPTPPNPNAARDAARDDSDLPPQLGGRRRGPRTFDNGQAPTGNLNSNPGPQPPPGTPQNPPAEPGTTTQQSPNGVATPQQIYDELLKKQQQQTTPPPQP